MEIRVYMCTKKKKNCISVKWKDKCTDNTYIGGNVKNRYVWETYCVISYFYNFLPSNSVY